MARKARAAYFRVMKRYTINDLPVFAAVVDPSDDLCGMKRVSLVDLPAVEKDFEAYASAERKAVRCYGVKDSERRLVYGVLMRADYPIYREDDNGRGFYIVYGKETLRVVAELYLKEGRQNRVVLDHDGNEVSGVNMVQMFIKDSARGVDPAGFEDVEDGSLFAEYHVTDDNIWEAVKAGTYRGFSIEIISGSVQLDAPGEIQNFKTKHKMNKKLSGILDGIARLLGAYGSITTKSAVLHWEGDGELEPGMKVTIDGEDGEQVPAPDGEYEAEDGRTILVVGGEVEEIRDQVSETSSEDGGDGVETEQVEEIAMRRQERFARIKAAFEESFDEKYRRIAEAVAQVLDTPDFYVVEAGEDFAVVSTWNAETFEEHYFRYAITWNEDGSANAADPVEVKQMFVPLDYESPFDGGARRQEEDPDTEDFRAEVESALGRIATFSQQLAQRVTALEKAPAAIPAHEEFKRTAEVAEDKNTKRKAMLDAISEAFSK